MTQAIEKKASPILTIANYIEARKPQIQKVMAAGMDIERITKIAISAVSRTPRLLECSPESIYSSIHTSVQLGLEIGGPLGEAYLVPHRNGKTGRYEAQFIPGYKGMIKLARNSGEIKKVYARIAYENDVFDLEQGLTENLTHKPLLTGDLGKPVIIYAVAHIDGADPQFEWMTVAEVDKIRARSKSKDSGPWVTDWEEMAKKTVFKRLAKWLPLSTSKDDHALATAIEHDNADTRFDIDVSATTPDAPALPDAGARVMERIVTLAAEAVTVEPPHDPATGEVTQAALPPLPETLSFEARRVVSYLDKGRVAEAAAALDKAIEGRHLEAGEEEVLTARVEAAR